MFLRGVCMIFFDFEVFRHDWLMVAIDPSKREKHVIVNDVSKLQNLYEAYSKDIWVGYNIKHYDQYILKGILLGMNPKTINDKIIVEGVDGWKISNAFRKIPLIMYDLMHKKLGLKTLEGFLGNSIVESGVDFNIDRKLTKEEIERTVKYCTHDVEQSIEVFLHKIDSFNSSMHLCKEFNLGLSHLSDTGAGITSCILGCVRANRDDEFDIQFLPQLQLGKYFYVLDWYKSQPKNRSRYYNNLVTNVAGVPHTFAWGGLHGAPSKPIHVTGSLYHVDVNNYYPSMLIAHDLVTRSATNNNYSRIYQTRKQLKMKQLNAKDKAEAKFFKKQQLPYKDVLNSLSGAMKDPFNQAFDPRNNNSMCVNGQLMLLDLIAHLEVIDGFQLIQSNTDGLIVKIPDTDDAFNQLDDICYEWETRFSNEKCEIGLALDQLKEIYQRDVNNYLWVNLDGSLGERIGVVKELSPLDYDLPIVNEALVAYMHTRKPIAETINECDEFIKFQKIVKLSSSYDYVLHRNTKYTNKCYRVFASIDSRDTKIQKVKVGGNPEKFSDTPNRCFIYNESVKGLKVPSHLDKRWYIEFATKRLNDFLGVKSSNQMELFT